MPLSGDPDARARQLANLQPGGDGPPAPETGNTRTLQHGGYARVSRDRLDAKVIELSDALAEDVPIVSTSDQLAIAELATKVCQLQDLRTYLAAHGFLDGDGDVRPAAELERKLSAQVDDKLDALGMTPRSRVKLGLDLSKAVAQAARERDDRVAAAKAAADARRGEAA